MSKTLCPSCDLPKDHGAELCWSCRYTTPLVDDIAVERLVTGSRVASNKAERVAAVQQLTRWGFSTKRIAERTGISTRSVTRHRGGL